MFVGASVQITRWSSLSNMKNVDVAWRLIDVVKELQKLKKDDECVTSYPGFESVCLNRWVLATAEIGLKTKQKKAYTTLFAEGNTTEDK